MADHDESVATEADHKLSLDVEISEVGACKKHVRVKISRDDIVALQSESVSELAEKAEVPGFRVGHAPHKLIEKKFRKELLGEVKQKVLLASLEQVSEEHSLDPINEPNIDVESLEIPEEGDFEYEFDVEVRPDFEIPKYEGLTIERPTREIGDKEVEAYLEKFLAQYSQLVPHEGEAEDNDYVIVNADFQHDGESIRKLSEIPIQVKPTLRFYDAELAGFDELMRGAKAGDSRDAELTISQEAETVEKRGETVQVQFTIEDVKRSRPPEMNKSFLERLGVEDEEELRKEVTSILERQVTYEQRQSTRAQVLEKITESADWDLPEELVMRQVDNALRREILEMQQAGFTTEQIQGREGELRQQAVSTTRQALKEHFVLDKIATQEGVEVSPVDIDSEIAMMAMQRGESPRRVRAKMVKSGMIENLEAQIRERKAVDVVLERASFKDVEMEEPVESDVVTVPEAICSATATMAEQPEEDAETGDE